VISPAFLLVAAATFFAFLSIGIVLPVLPRFAEGPLGAANVRFVVESVAFALGGDAAQAVEQLEQATREFAGESVILRFGRFWGPGTTERRRNHQRSTSTRPAPKPRASSRTHPRRHTSLPRLATSPRSTRSRPRSERARVTAPLRRSSPNESPSSPPPLPHRRRPATALNGQTPSAASLSPGS